jgi:hypothetical protein
MTQNKSRRVLNCVDCVASEDSGDRMTGLHEATVVFIRAHRGDDLGRGRL